MKTSIRISEEDAKKLDTILETAMQYDYQIFEDSFKDKNIVNIEDEKLRNLEYDRLFSIIGQSGKANYIINNNYLNGIERNKETKNFLDNGGFVKQYQDELNRLKKDEEIKELSNTKLYWDSKISKWQVKTFWPVFIFGLFGLTFGIYNFIDQLKGKKITEELIQDNLHIKEELSKLRTLILDQKTVDSLHNAKNQTDSLRKK